MDNIIYTKWDYSKLWKSKKPEILIMSFFVVFYCIIAVFHEPWFDEAQAWQIARCASFKKMFFEIPHYEGHPPFWYLILALPAKTGIPFEIGLKVVGFLIAITSASLIIFRSKLPKIARLLFPFSFFVFYQYGIIVRPYGLMLLLMILLGLEFHKRNIHPWKFTVLLMLLCVTSAYGIVISGGIALCMVWELHKEKGFKKLFSEIITDNRTRALLLLLVLAISLIVHIMPRQDTWVTSANGRNSTLKCLFCTLFTLVGDCFITDSIWFSTDTHLLQNANIPIYDLFANCVFGIIIWLAIVSAASKRNLKWFVVPYILFAVFSAFIYVSAHHLGIALMILLFWLELNSEDANRFEIGKKIISMISKTSRDEKWLKSAAFIFLLSCLIVPVYWSVNASIREIRYDYSYGRKVSSFIRENQLEDCLILSSWGENSSEKYGKMIGHEDYLNTYENGNPVTISAYFDHNIFYNLGNGSDQEAYMHYRMADYESSKQTMKTWASLGIPEVLVGKPKLEALFGKSVTYNDYSMVFAGELNYIWKNKTYHAILPIYLRNDLFNKYNLEPITDLKYALINGLKVNDDMRKQYDNGVPVEEILKPYLDAIFGEEG